MSTAFTAAVSLAIFIFSISSKAQSVTKCGNSGPDSYYNSTTLPYVFYNNPWGNDDSGFSCMTVKDNGTAFDATWRWLNNSEKVHAYPHFKLDSPLYPLSLTQLSAVDFTGDWGINVTSALEQDNKAREQALNDNDVQYNVALDMFLDANETMAQADLPHYEIMVWLSYSYNVYPVGIDTSSPDVDQFVINGTRFFLYHGNNTQGQTVFSWLPEHNLTHTAGDFSPLVHYLWQFNFMPQDVYLGTIQFGTETFHATSEVLFSAGNYSLSIGQDENLQVAPLEAPKPVKVPSQVPTMARFDSRASAGVVVYRWEVLAALGLVTLFMLQC